MTGRYLLNMFCAVLAIAGTACKDEPEGMSDSPGYIEFYPGEDGREVTTTENISSFKVTAVTGHSFVMKDVTVTRAGLNKWIYSPPVRWPEGKNVDFYAVSPPEIDFSVNTSWHTIIRYTSPGNQDLLVATNFGASPSSGGLRINFRHALSRALVRLRTSRTDIEVRVRSVAVRNVARSGEFYFPDVSTVPGAENGPVTDCWKTYYNDGYYPIFKAEGDSYIALSDTLTTVDNIGTTYFIPCELWDMKYEGYFSGSMLEVSYQFADKSSGKRIWPYGTLPAQLHDPENYNYGIARLPLSEGIPTKRWESGKVYRYDVSVDRPSELPVSRSGGASATVEVSIGDFQ